MSFIKVTDPRKREALIRDFIETRKRIKDSFIAKKVGESEYQTGLSKLFKPVTETQKATAKEITEAQKEATEKITQGLLPIKERLENLTVMPIQKGDPIPTIKPTQEQITIIGDTAVKYLEKTHGRIPTKSDIIPVNLSEGLFKIGKTPVKVAKNDLIIEGIDKIKGTDGLWRLLSSKDIPDKSEYKANDLREYIYIMYFTNTTRQDFDKNNKRISGNNKMEKLIKPFVSALEERGDEKLIKEIEKHFGIETYEEDEDEEDEDEEEGNAYSLFGDGLKILPSDPNALIDRFDLLFSSKKAGHTGVRNEIVSILDELKRQGVINVQEYKKLNSIIKK